MMLFKISLKNIKKSFKDYAIYFVTLILGVAIFYTFNSLDSQTVMLDVSKASHRLINLMIDVLSGVSIFVSFVLGFLIIYASRFLIKRRNKEFSVYLTLGMSKRKISTILLIETLLIGIISLFVGLFLGIIISQGMSVVVANLFDINLTKYTFVFSKLAFTKTLIYFSIMYLLVMLFNTIVISKCKLIDLINSSKKSEKIKIKNPYICIIVFIIGAIMLGYAYYKVTVDFESLQEFYQILIPIGLGMISTFLIFWSLSGLILKIVLSIKKVYYNNLNSFILRQINSKINTTVFSMTIICLMLFITICALSSSLSIKTATNNLMESLVPADLQVEKRKNDYMTKEDNDLDIKGMYNKLNIDIDYYLKEQINFNAYNDPNLTLKDSLGSKYDDIIKRYPFLYLKDLELILKISDYNKVARIYNLEEFNLNEDEYMIIANYDSMEMIRNIALNNNEELIIFNKKYKPKYKECQNGFIEMSSSYTNQGIIIIPDIEIDDEYIAFENMIGNYKEFVYDDLVNIERKLLLEDKSYDFQRNTGLSVSSKRVIYDSAVGLGVLFTFLALYLGIIFLISSAALLSLKELSDSTDNIERFKVLRKIGTDEKLINRAIFTEIGIFFLFPLILAIIHSIFGLKFATIILETFGKEGMLSSVAITALFIVLIYGTYFLVTYFCSKNIIKEK